MIDLSPQYFVTISGVIGTLLMIAQVVLLVTVERDLRFGLTLFVAGVTGIITSLAMLIFIISRL